MVFMIAFLVFKFSLLESLLHREYHREYSKSITIIKCFFYGALEGKNI